jgi:hypothetical protein
MSTMRFSRIGISLFGFFFMAHGAIGFAETFIAVGVLSLAASATAAAGFGVLLSKLVPIGAGYLIIRNADSLDRAVRRLMGHGPLFPPHAAATGTGHPEIDRWRERV